ncbi:ABC transporter substrate-binding protein [Leucobacter sp. OLJS4]|uniref:endolytic transglycosylase MltG n=1 Tax=unclassified Leucobacter TaxID=2621730 RepID=UPI000C191899|nr:MULTISPECIES: endolytic transglycosylase MltG [unclassified Leucobacter]PII81615.1 ABC transporter substrate-binding protein [Leucobacter sp. OLCALW19]PII86286.1 ABC transporter substrate-binding protein [Leucobacter sp. OLTLW20]PII90181.1 ABC transporter substrate-binding protein [Leucobacter sp. OLAS13]PII97214.1 ABC transporter substrate-binding protein [Leucobacter sp. OLDS2]PIJ01526.1 ABC transporter substrate-binding protein [Leucobacter sp. OLCS4]
MNAREKRGRRAKRESSTGKRVLIVLLVAVLLLGGLGAGVAVLWSSFGAQVSKAMGWEKNDYEGSGTGSAVVTIREGEIGSDIAASLAKQGVVKTSEAFYDLLLKQDPAVEFQVGSYQLKKQMSAKAALAALQDPKNQIKLTVTIPEGMAAGDALARISKVTGIPQADFDAAVKDPSKYGIPKAAPSIEGFLFPATYTFEPGDTAESIIKKMVERMGQALREHGVPEADELRVLTLASIVQREAGSNQADFPKIARVFQNRLDQGMKLQSDATVAYGTGNTHTVWTTEAERADASNKYNTYANPGLPIGPIGLPGDVAIAAAMKPAPGKWLYFVPINLETGETVFSETNEQHEAAVAKLGQWCEAHRAQGGKRCD